MIASAHQIADRHCTADEPHQSDRGLSLLFTRVFTPNCIEMIGSPSDKSSIIRQLVHSLASENRIDQRSAERIAHQVLHCESHGSSAIGRGLAFPHLRTTEVGEFVGAIGIAPVGVDFESIDHELTKLVFLIISPINNRESHIGLLSRLVSLMKDKAVNMHLHHAIRPEDIYGYLADLDGQFAAELPASRIISQEPGA